MPTDADLEASLRADAALGIPAGSAALVVTSESNFNPSIENSVGCVGLNQFCGETFSGAVNIPIAQYRQLTAAQQLDNYITPWWLGLAKTFGFPTSARDLYWLNFTRQFYKPGLPPSATVGGADVAAANPALAHGKNIILASDLDQRLAAVAAANPTMMARIATLSPATPVQTAFGLLAASALVGLLVGATGYAAYTAMSEQRRYA